MNELELPAVEWLHQRIRLEVEECEPHRPLVLDVGAGLATYHVWLKEICELVTLDVHAPYLSASRTDLKGVKRIIGDAREVIPLLRLYEFDLILAIDFIEHLTKEDAKLLISEMGRISEKIVIFTPEGHHPQDHDVFGMGADHWQTHRSEWKKEDLEALGFTVEVWEGFHKTWNSKCDPNALWATWSY